MTLPGGAKPPRQLRNELMLTAGCSADQDVLMTNYITVTNDDEATTSVTTSRGNVRILLSANAPTIQESQALCREHIFNIQAADLAVDDEEVEFLVHSTWAKPQRVATLRRAE